MNPTKEQIKAYKKMAKSSPSSMVTKIRSVLEKTCDKFAGHEDRLDDCIAYLTECAREILDGKSGDVDDETCYRICRDYFNDELWDKDEKKPAKKAAQAPDLEMTEPTPDTETPAEREETKPTTKPEPGQCSLFDLAGFANA